MPSTNGGSATATVVATPTTVLPGPVDESEPARKMFSAKVFALLVPLVYLCFIVYLMLGKFTDIVPGLKGGDAAAIVGGLAALLLFAASATNDKRNFLETSSEHVVDGLVFAFKAMGIVLPIAGFFSSAMVTSRPRSSACLPGPRTGLPVRPHHRRPVTSVSEPPLSPRSRCCSSASSLVWKVQASADCH